MMTTTQSITFHIKRERVQGRAHAMQLLIDSHDIRWKNDCGMLQPVQWVQGKP
jgi:hypothetical protein